MERPAMLGERFQVSAGCAFHRPEAHRCLHGYVPSLESLSCRGEQMVLELSPSQQSVQVFGVFEGGRRSRPYRVVAGEERSMHDRHPPCCLAESDFVFTPRGQGFFSSKLWVGASMG